MNQQCKVCGEPAAGFHFGAFTCEGCKSFFGRSYNNLSSISECKNNGECVINKKNRTACKACRLRKCLLVGMSKSGSRYGRRSNWFKIHCLLQEQQQQAQQAGGRPLDKTPPPHPALSMLAPPFPPHLFPGLHSRPPCSKEELLLLGLDEYKKSTSPSISSPDSHNSDSSINVDDSRRFDKPSIFSHKMPTGPELPASMAGGKDLFMPLPFTNLGSIPGFPPTFLPPPSAFNALSASHQHLLFPGAGFHPALYPHHQGLLKAATTNNNNRYIHNNNHNELNVDSFTKRFYLDAVLKSQRSSPSSSSIKSNHLETEVEEVEPEVHRSPKQTEAPVKPVPISLSSLNYSRGLSVTRKGSESPIQENPMDLSMKSGSFSSDERRQTPSETGSDIVDAENDDDDIDSNGMRSNGSASDADEELELSKEREVKRIKIHRSTPLDLTTKV